jgi:hypothetical protein
MNKTKALLSVLLTVLLLVPMTLVTADLTTSPALVKDTFTLDTSDDLALSVKTDSNGKGDYTLKINGVSFGDVTIQDDSSASYEFFSVPVSYLYKQLGEDIADLEDVKVELIHSTDTAKNMVDYININIKNLVASDTPLFEAHSLIRDVEIVEEELTYGDEIEFEIELETVGEQRISDLTIEVEFDGEDIETREFKMFGDDDDNVELTFDQTDFKTRLSIPSSVDDIEEDTYNFVVRVYGREEVDSLGEDGLNLYHLLDVFTIEGGIEVEKMDDNLAIEGVHFEQQGNVLYTAILVENIGLNNEEDVVARIQIADLDVKQSSNRVTVYEDDDATIYVPVVLPSLTTGDYDIKITVMNDDVSVARIAEDVELQGIVAPQTSAELVIGVDTAIKTVSPTGAVYAMTFTNNGNTAKTITLETAGAEWGQTSVNPSTVVVGAGTSEIASVFVAPNAGEAGTKQFTVFVKEGNQIVKSVGLTANVEGSAATGSAVYDFSNLVDSGLKWVAAILVVVLIVLFVVWSWNKADEEEL